MPAPPGNAKIGWWVARSLSPCQEQSTLPRKGQEAHLCPTYLAPRQLSDEELGAAVSGAQYTAHGLGKGGSLSGGSQMSESARLI